MGILKNIGLGALGAAGLMLLAKHVQPVGKILR